jgi:diadenosine tetraphosphate (Ap4A) HIT family hydrolase
LIDASDHVLYEDVAYVVVGPGASRCARGHFTLVPRTHVSVLAELDAGEMAAVLAGLSKLSKAVKEVCGVADVDLWAHPLHAAGSRTHLHFHAATKSEEREESTNGCDSHAVAKVLAGA